MFGLFLLKNDLYRQDIFYQHIPAHTCTPGRRPRTNESHRTGMSRDLVPCRYRDGVQNRLDRGAWPLAFGVG